MRRLNGWQRIGVVLSILWILGFSLFIRVHYTDSAQKYATSMVKMCEDTAPEYRTPKGKDCWDSYLKSFWLDMEGFWGDWALLTFVPISLTWGLVYLVIGTTRWVRKGFANK